MEMFTTSDLGEGEPVSLSDVWRSLLSGHEAVTHGFFTERRYGIQLSSARDAAPPAGQLTGRPRLILESLLRGVCQTNLAIDLRLAPSTVSLNAKLALRQLGLDERPSRVHPLLMLAASLSSSDATSVGALSLTLPDGTRVVSGPRADLCLNGLLPRAQRETLALRIEGRSLAEIALHRGTSPRTVANQLAATFRALNASGRTDVLQKLFVLSGWLPAPAAHAA
jgi:DNA-binding NarL/FixJ family response regulator